MTVPALTADELVEVPLAGADGWLLSAPFIVDDHYGTRCSTVLLVSRDGGAYFAERSFGPGGQLIGTVIERFGRSATAETAPPLLPLSRAG